MFGDLPPEERDGVQPFTRRPRASYSVRVTRLLASVTVSGRLRPAVAGATVSVAAHGPRGWSTQQARVGADGRFATTWELHRGAVYVAQWKGAPGIAGDGTAPLRVRLGAHKRR